MKKKRWHKYEVVYSVISLISDHCKEVLDNIYEFYYGNQQTEENLQGCHWEVQFICLDFYANFSTFIVFWWSVYLIGFPG